MKNTLLFFFVIICCIACSKSNIVPDITIAINEENSTAAIAGTVYITNTLGNLYALDANSGAIRWQYQSIGSFEGTGAISNGILYEVSSYPECALHAINASTGSIVWKTKFPKKAIFSTGSPTVANGIVYVNMNGQLYAVKEADGSILWQDYFADISETQLGSSPTVVNGRVYVAFGSIASLFSLDALTGNQYWVKREGTNIYSSPCVVNAGVYYNTINYLSVVKATQGKSIWSIHDENIMDFASPAYYNGQIYTTTWDNNNALSFRAVNATTGATNWDYPTNGLGHGDPLIIDSLVYYLGSNNLYALDAVTGTNKWNLSLPQDTTGSLKSYSGPCGTSDIIYVPGMDKTLYAIKLKTRKVLWSFHYGGDDNRTSPCLLLNNGKSYYPTVSGLLQ